MGRRAATGEPLGALYSSHNSLQGEGSWAMGQGNPALCEGIG